MSATLVLGGARSGKSQFAEALLSAEAEVDYVATAFDGGEDAQWSARIALHRARRAASWRTIETADVAEVLTRPGPAALVDSVTTWLARVMDGGASSPGQHGDAIEARLSALADACAVTPRTVVLVSDEVGLGIVPATESGRDFRDALGQLNQRLAQACEAVHLVVAGIPMRLR